MIGSPEVPAFDASAFDENFFESYEEQMADLNIEDQASQALAGILTVEKDDGTLKTYDQIRDESQAFFANDWVKEDEALMNRMATEFAMACMSHNHGSMLAQDETLGQVFETGVNNLYGDSHDHEHNTVTQLQAKKENDEIDPKTGKKKNKKRKRG